MPKPLQGRAVLPLFLFLIACFPLAAQSDAALPDAPQADASAPPRDTKGHTPAAPPATTLYPHRYAEVIEPEWTTHPLTPGEKMIFALRENLHPIILIPALYSMGYEQLRGSDPKYGSNSAAGAAKFGASMAHSASVRVFTDGVFAPAFHQDPRYYRMARGSIWRRGIYAAERALVRRSDDGRSQFNYSDIAGRAAAAVLTLAYYPPVSRNQRVVLSTFAFSVLTDAGGDLVFEFVPDVARKLPFIKRVEIE